MPFSQLDKGSRAFFPCSATSLQTFRIRTSILPIYSTSLERQKRTLSVCLFMEIDYQLLGISVRIYLQMATCQ